MDISQITVLVFAISLMVMGGMTWAGRSVYRAIYPIHKRKTAAQWQAFIAATTPQFRKLEGPDNRAFQALFPKAATLHRDAYKALLPRQQTPV